MHTTERLRTLAHAIAESLRCDNPDVLGIYAYGSVGRGDATPVSDLDLHVVLPDPPDPLHWTFEREGTVVGISYHERRMYEADLEQLLTEEQGTLRLSRAESLWEAADAFILYDPRGLVARFVETASRVRRHPRLVRRRALLSIQDGLALLCQAQSQVTGGSLAGALNTLYRLTGGSGSSGALPLALRALAQLGDEALSTRRLFLRARAAAARLDFDLTDVMAAYGILPGLPLIPGDEMRNILLHLFDTSRRYFENAPLPDTAVRAEVATHFTDLQRHRLAASVSELCAQDHAACIVFASGMAQSLLGLDRFPHPWLEATPDGVRLALTVASARLAGIDELSRGAVAGRVDLAGAVLKAVHRTGASLQEGRT